jgi:hypothetical protein
MDDDADVEDDTDEEETDVEVDVRCAPTARGTNDAVAGADDFDLIVEGTRERGTGGGPLETERRAAGGIHLKSDSLGVELLLEVVEDELPKSIPSYSDMMNLHQQYQTQTELVPITQIIRKARGVTLNRKR